MKAKLIAALVLGGLMAASPAFAKDYTVKMLNSGTDGSFVFQPGYLHVQPGDTVTFKAVDAAHDSRSIFVPDGATTWDGEIGKDVTVTLTKQGVYIYECVPHHTLGMVGVIQVGEATNLKAAKAKAAKVESKQVMNKDRLTQYMNEVK